MARQFNGTTDEMSTTNNSNLDLPTTSWSECMWYLGTASSGGNFSLFGKSTTGGKDSYEILYGGERTLYCSVTPGNSYPTFTTTLTADTWYFLHAHWTSGSKVTLDVYNADLTLNQTVETSTTKSGSITYNSQVFKIGYVTGSVSGHFKGKCSYLGVWKTVLTSTESFSFARGNIFVQRSNQVVLYPLLGDGTEQDWSGLNSTVTTTTGTTHAASNPPYQHLENYI